MIGGIGFWSLITVYVFLGLGVVSLFFFMMIAYNFSEEKYPLIPSPIVTWFGVFLLIAIFGITKVAVPLIFIAVYCEVKRWDHSDPLNLFKKITKVMAIIGLVLWPLMVSLKLHLLPWFIGIIAMSFISLGALKVGAVIYLVYMQYRRSVLKDRNQDFIERL